MHARRARIDELGAHGHEIADQDRLDELDAADRDRDAIAPAPADGRGVAGPVDPLHDHAAVDLAAEIDVGRLGQEAERDLALLAWHRGSSRRENRNYAVR